VWSKGDRRIERTRNRKVNSVHAAPRHKLAQVGSDELQVVLDQLKATAVHWQGLSAQLTGAAPPSSGQLFQATTAAVSGVNATIGVAAAAFASRIQATAAGMTSAVAGYAKQEATGAGEMAAVTQVTVV
jgi:hypothetical protein